jgi:hypothetical protein
MTKNAPSTGWNPRVQKQIDAAYSPSPKMKALIERTQAQLDEIERQALAPPQPASKYNAKRTAYKSVQGFERVYASKAEAERAKTLDDMVTWKTVRWWLPQVPIPLPGGVKMVADFLIFWKDGSVSFEDVKGVVTQTFTNKSKQAKSQFGITVEIVGKSR